MMTGALPGASSRSVRSTLRAPAGMGVSAPYSSISVSAGSTRRSSLRPLSLHGNSSTHSFASAGLKSSSARRRRKAASSRSFRYTSRPSARSVRAPGVFSSSLRRSWAPERTMRLNRTGSGKRKVTRLVSPLRPRQTAESRIMSRGSMPDDARSFSMRPEQMASGARLRKLRLSSSVSFAVSPGR